MYTKFTVMMIALTATQAVKLENLQSEGCMAGEYLHEGVCTTCPAGRYCPEGTKALARPCPPGTYSSMPGMWYQSDCVLCPANMYCFWGSAEPKACPPYTSSYAGAGNRWGCMETCPAGFQMSESMGCEECHEGNYCMDYAEPETCPQGFYCPGMTVYPVMCPEGTSTDFEGASSADDCSKAKNNNDCMPGEFEDTNTGECIMCPAGYYCMDGVTEMYPCPMDAYCPAGSMQPYFCPSGSVTYVAGASSMADCVEPQGEEIRDDITDAENELPAAEQEAKEDFEEHEDGTQPAEPEQPKEYDGQYTQDQCMDGDVNEGGMCVHVGLIGECPSGQMESQDGSSCVDCSEGNYCIEGDYYPSACPANFYCPAGSVAPIACPEGTQTMGTNSWDAQDCY